MTNKQKRAYAKAFDKYSATVENKYRPQIEAALNRQVKQFIDYAENVGFANALTLIDHVVTVKPIEDVLKRLYLVEGKKSGRREQQHLNATFGAELKSAPGMYTTKSIDFFTDWLDSLRMFFFNEGFLAVTRITETTRNWLREKTSKAVDEGKTFPQIRDELITDGINRSRANVIVRTEVITVLNNANHVAAEDSDLVFIREWSATLDKRTRHTHVAINGEVITGDQHFSNGGMYPGDPALSAKERIQCRCTVIRSPLRDVFGKLVLKK
jgi:SPP1 gp7 family putative phage head morphogenesis protein